MNRCGVDPKVKKTLVRNYEQKLKKKNSAQVVHDMDANSSKYTIAKTSRSSQKENELNQPTLCSSDAIANYLSQVKQSISTPHSSEYVHSGTSTEITKKLNFHFNDTIYKNLIELNTNMEHLKLKKDKRPTSSKSVKKDVEPNIEDFCDDEKEIDSPPYMPVPKLKIKPLLTYESGELHKLVASLEDL